MPWLYDEIHHIAVVVADAAAQGSGFVEWLVTAIFDGIFGLVLGMLLIPVVTRVIAPIFAALSGKEEVSH